MPSRSQQNLSFRKCFQLHTNASDYENSKKTYPRHSNIQLFIRRQSEDQRSENLAFYNYNLSNVPVWDQAFRVNYVMHNNFELNMADIQ